MIHPRVNTYEQLLLQIPALLEGETNLIANLANFAAAIKQELGFFWVGFYLVENEGLVLGPFQGPVACTRIGFGKGVCGSAWAQNKTFLVPDVHAFPGHIACNAASNAEIVIPVRDACGKVRMVLDIDSTILRDFDETDQHFLEKLVTQLEQTI